MRVKFFLDSDLTRLIHNKCIYSTFSLESDGSLDLKKVRDKWGLYDCQVCFSSLSQAGEPEYVSVADLDGVQREERDLRCSISKGQRHVIAT